MKKLLSIVLMLCISIGLIGCGSKEQSKSPKKDPKEIIEGANFQDSGWIAGLIWGCTFSDMNLTVLFNDKDPEAYYANKPLLATEIKSIEVRPDKTKKNEWIYIIFKDGKFMVDGEDIEQYKDKGREEALKNYNNKRKELGITTEDIGSWLIKYFNENVRTKLVNQAENSEKELIEKIKSSGYTHVKDSKGRTIISSKKDAYKIILNSGNCMVVNSDMDIDSNSKNGYLYTANLGTVGNLKNDKTTFIFDYSQNVTIEGKASLEEYADIQELKKWYDAFLKKLNTNTEALINAK